MGWPSAEGSGPYFKAANGVAAGIVAEKRLANLGGTIPTTYRTSVRYLETTKHTELLTLSIASFRSAASSGGVGDSNNRLAYPAFIAQLTFCGSAPDCSKNTSALATAATIPTTQKP